MGNRRKAPKERKQYPREQLLCLLKLVLESIVVILAANFHCPAAHKQLGFVR